MLLSFSCTAIRAELAKRRCLFLSTFNSVVSLSFLLTLENRPGFKIWPMVYAEPNFQ